MSILVTGANGYLGSYVVNELVGRTRKKLILMVRGDTHQERVAKLWKGMQLHMDRSAFRDALARMELVNGDLHAPDLGWGAEQRRDLLKRVTSIIHAAASLNRKSAKACFNTNLRGGMSVLMFAREGLADKGRLQRYSFVSTVAVAGHRQDEDIEEDAAIEWSRSDYDPYARTKKFGEHMVREILKDESFVIFRPAILLGDGEHERTTQFDMVRALVGLADLPLVPLRPTDRVDIVNTAYAGEAIARIHLMKAPRWDCSASAGAKSPAAGQLLDALSGVGVKARLLPRLDRPFNWVFRAMNRAPRGSMVSGIGALMKVFWPYIRYNTVFLNDRVVTELGREPVPFVDYAADLYTWVKANRFTYPYAETRHIG